MKLSTYMLTYILVVLLGAVSSAQTKARILVGPNTLVDWHQEGTYREPWIAASPMNPNHLFAGVTFRGLTHFTPGNRYEQADRGFYSRDGGATWRTIMFPEAVRMVSGDPRVAFGSTGMAYFTTLTFYERDGLKNGLYFYRSADSGMTWDPPVRVTEGDHEVIAVDQTTGPFAGRVYLGLLQAQGHDRLDYHIVVFRSQDDGHTWIGPIDIANNDADRTFGCNVQSLLVFTDGELFAAINAWDSRDNSTDSVYHFLMATSRDGGVTFTPAQRPRAVGGGEFTTAPASGAPMFAVDQSTGPTRNRLYAVWTDRAFAKDSSVYRAKGSRILLSYSSDRGKMWSKPKMIAPGQAGVGDQFSAVVAVNQDGVLAIAWDDTRETPMGGSGPIIRRHVTASVDGGETFLPARPLASSPTDYHAVANTPVGSVPESSTNFGIVGGTPRDLTAGDYWALAAAADGTFHALWSDGRTGTYQLWAAKIRVDRPTVSAVAPTSYPPPGMVLVETEVTDFKTYMIEVMTDPLRSNSPPGTIEIPVRLRNTSNQPIYGPLKVGLWGHPRGVLLNAINGESDSTAVMDYSRALGDFDVLLPGTVTEAVIWRFKAPAKASEFPNVYVKVTARIAVDSTAGKR